MWSILGSLVGLIDPITKITDKIVQLKIQQSNATTEQEKIKSAEDIAILQGQRDVMIAEAQYNARTNQLIRFFFVVPVGLYVWKLIVWDKLIASWPSYSTDDLSDHLWWIVLTVIGFYFVQNIARILKK